MLRGVSKLSTDFFLAGNTVGHSVRRGVANSMTDTTLIFERFSYVGVRYYFLHDNY